MNFQPTMSPENYNAWHGFNQIRTEKMDEFREKYADGKGWSVEADAAMKRFDLQMTKPISKALGVVMPE